MPITDNSRCAIFRRCCKMPSICVILIILVWLILAVIFPFGIDKEDYKANMTSKAESKQAVHDVASKTNRVIEHKPEIHQDRTVGDFSTNSFSRLMTEYVKVMDVKDCYVCVKLPASVSEGVKYNMLPLTYGITCSVIASLFYQTGRLEYYYSDYDEMFANLKVVNSLNKVRPAKQMREFFLVTNELTYEYAYKNNLTCKMRDEERSFPYLVEERRAIYKRNEMLKQTKSTFWQMEDDKLNGGYRNAAIHIDDPVSGKFCIRRDNTLYDNYFVGASQCEDTYRIIGGWGFKGGKDPIFPGIYFVYGNKAYFSLPDHWYGTCYLGLVFPKMFHVDRNAEGSFEIGKHLNRYKRESFSDIMGDIFGVIMPMVGITLNSIKIRKVSTIVDRLSTDTASGFQLVNTELVATRSMVMQNRLALDILLAKEGGVCGILHVQHCCTYFPDKSQNIEMLIKNITEFHSEIEPMESDNFPERLSKRFEAIGKWFGEIGISIIGKVLYPVIIIVIVTLLLKISCMIHKRKKHMREKRRIYKLRKAQEKEIEMEEFRRAQYESSRQTAETGV